MEIPTLNIAGTEPDQIENFFHDFEVVNRHSGRKMRMTQVGPNPEYAANTIRNHNLKGLDFENDYHLVHIP